MKTRLISCSFRVKNVAYLTLLSVTVLLLILYEVKELHSRPKLGPVPAVESKTNHEGGQLFVGRTDNLRLDDQSGNDWKRHKLVSKPEMHTLSLKLNISLAEANHLLINDGNLTNHQVEDGILEGVQQRMLIGTGREIQQTCQIPQLDPFDSIFNWYTRRQPRLMCNEGVELTDIKNKTLVLNKLKTEKVTSKFCYVSTIDRVTDSISLVSSPTKISTSEQNLSSKRDVKLQYKLSSDFIVVGCFGENYTLSGVLENLTKDAGDNYDAFYRRHSELFDIHATIVPKPEVLRRSRNTKPPKDGLGLNVVMLGFEGISRSSFVRLLPKTTELLGDFGSVVLEGYNIVASGTLGALVPILTGKTLLELPEVRNGEPNASLVDIYPMIWKEYKKNGYVTMFVEDSPLRVAAFNLRLNGFGDQPTDHYMRTLWNAAEVKGHCLGPKPVHRVTLDYLLDYMTVYRDRPHFDLSFFADLIFKDFVRLKLMDSDLHQFLTTAKNHGLLNNTILFMFGDHGQRVSPIRMTAKGKLEERLPFMSVTLPEWVTTRQPTLYKNLMKNSKRLTTPFDIHETLRSVLHYSPEPVSVKQRGISLFSKIPLKRTCDDAHVAPHWCTCLTWEPVNPQKTSQVGKALIDGINAKTKAIRSMCKKLKLGVVLQAEKVVPNEQVYDNVHREVPQIIGAAGRQLKPASNRSSARKVADLSPMYRVTVKASSPCDSVFEGTVRVFSRSKAGPQIYQAMGDISRLNWYGGKADCIKDLLPHVMQFCCCKNEHPPKRK